MSEEVEFYVAVATVATAALRMPMQTDVKSRMHSESIGWLPFGEWNWTGRRELRS
jgi:hypothetical protein